MLTATLPCLFLAAGGWTQPPPAPTARAIPGITAPDAFPRACVDCHVNRPDIGLDVRLSTLMGAWTKGVDGRLMAKAHLTGVTLQGRHPEVPASTLEDVPASCLACHAAGSTSAPPFEKLMHVIHLTGGQENHFLTLFGGECTHCHKLDAGSGAWTLPSAPEPAEEPVIVSQIDR